jgi:hypothetical protein
MAALAAAAPAAVAAVGDWTNYTPLSQVRDIEPVPGGILVATGGGVRRVALPSREETVFRNTEGLTDVSVQALARASDGSVWASSELGYLYRLPPGASRWNVHGSSYKAAGWRMSRRAMLYRQGYLVLGSEKGLSFFNTRKLVADVNITKMGSVTGMAVRSLLMDGDTLYAGTDKGIFRAVLRLDRLLTDTETNVFNPAIWSLVSAVDTVPAVDTASGGDGEVEEGEDCVPGLLYRKAGGIAGACAGMFLPELGGLLISGVEVRAGGRAWPDTMRMEALARSEGRWFIGGGAGLFEFDPKTDSKDVIFNPEDLPFGRITMVEAGPGGVYAYIAPHFHKLTGGLWKPVRPIDATEQELDLYWRNAVDADKRGSHPLHSLPSGDLFLGTWGHGFRALQDGKWRFFDAAPGGSCMESTLENINYPVVWSMAPLRTSGIFIGSVRHGKSYGLSYYDFESKTLECFQTASADEHPKALEVVGDSVLVVTTGRGLEAFRVREAGGRVSLDAADLLSPRVNAPEPILVSRMDDRGTLWITSEGGKLFYVPDIRFGSGKALIYRTLEGFPGADCKNLESDARGHLWAGCSQGGVVEIMPGRDSLSHSFRRYRLDDGLLSETILHLDIDRERGDVWIVTENGLTRFESPSRPLARSLSSAKVYPNPFRARHDFVLFDGLSAGSEIQVLTQGGSVVYRASLGADGGGQVRWDGRNAAGRKVKEGIYFYVIRSPGEVKRGKLVVAR